MTLFIVIRFVISSNFYYKIDCCICFVLCRLYCYILPIKIYSVEITSSL